MSIFEVAFGLVLLLGGTQNGAAPEPEAAFIACLAEKKPELIAKIRDASDQEGFLQALQAGTETCPATLEGMSMGKLFKALNAYKREKSDA